MYFVRFAQPWILFIILVLLIMVWLLRIYFYKPIRYQYSLTSVLFLHKVKTAHPYKKIFFLIQSLILLLLGLSIARPQLVDSRSKVEVEGIDIVLVFDVSLSMANRDFDGLRTRFKVSQDEAIRFIEKRSNDAIGLVTFANGAVTRCPLTLDKIVLKQIIQNIKIGDINGDGTFMAHGLMIAINRLKYSEAKSKVIVLLTDGLPHDEQSLPTAVAIAKKMGIKIYAIGIGFDGFGSEHAISSKILQYVSLNSDGEAFFANDSQQMRNVYDTIDSLEKTEHEVPIFTRYWDFYQSIVLVMLGLFLLELLLSIFVWFSI